MNREPESHPPSKTIPDSFSNGCLKKMGTMEELVIEFYVTQMAAALHSFDQRLNWIQLLNILDFNWIQLLEKGF